MTSKDFVKSIVNGSQTKPRRVASLMFDGVTLYSYSTNYPLLFKIGGAWIVNDTGYSSTTAKHISYARQESSYSVKLAGTVSILPKNLAMCCTDELAEIKKDLQELSARAFKQRETKTERHGEILKTLNFLNSQSAHI